MSNKVVTVERGSSFFDVAKIMKNKNINHVPVINEKGELCGIIARGDMIRYIASTIIE